MDDLEKIEKDTDKEKHKFTKKDIFAIMIAQFEILAPIVIVFCIGIWLIMFLLVKFWLKA